MLQLDKVGYTVAADGGKRDILKDISLTFRNKAITVITGHNGSGKSTLIRLISGIERPTSGKIIYDGKDITDMAVDERARMGFTLALQQPVRFKGITVKKLLDIACGHSNNLNGLCEYLSAVGLCARDYINREVDSSLSGGELKRIEIAMALAKGGDVFLLDEPEAGIDLWSFDELTGIFRRLKDKTVIIVSHQSKILEIADDIVLLDSAGEPKIGGRDEMLPLLGNYRRTCAKIQGDSANG
ncbi:MAG: ATP-binding cassette domain-containing protein [Clostridia bacterium]|nr:ATP-binding cassette domain-containing protein [Clostridia bacterium]